MKSTRHRAFLGAALLQALIFVIWIPAWEVMSGDEASAYARGTQLLHAGDIPNLEYSPLHAAYYAAFQFIFDDYYAVVIVSKAFLLAASALFVLALLLRHFPSRSASFATALMMLSLSAIQLFSIRYISMLGILLVLFLLSAGSQRVRELGLLSTLLLPLIRPEYILLPPPLLITAAYLEYQSTRALRLSFVLSAGLSVVVVTLLGWSLAQASGDGSRSWVAFKQHFAWGYLERQDPMAMTRQFPDGARINQIATNVFGAETDSINEAWRANPDAFAQHILWNLLWLPTAGHAGIIGLVIYLGWFGGAAILIASRKHLRAFPASTWHTALMLGICLVFMFPSMLLVRPRSDYLLSSGIGLGVFIACLVASVFQARLASRARLSLVWSGLQVAVLVALLAGTLVLMLSYKKPGLKSLRLLDRNLPRAEFGIMSDSAICRFTAPERPCREVSFDLAQLKVPVAQANQWFATHGIDWIWFPSRYSDPSAETFARQLQLDPLTAGWARVDSNSEGSLFTRRP